MSKKTTGTDVGYRAYFAAFAVMIVIIIAAVSILSGCFDSIIFKADTSAIGDTDANQPPVDTDGDTDVAPDTGDIILGTDSGSMGGDTESVAPPDSDSDTEKDTDADTTESDDTTKNEDTTKKEDTTAPITTPEVTTSPATTPEATTPEATTPEETTTVQDIDPSEIITGQDNSILYSYQNDGLVITGYDGLASSISVSKELDGTEVNIIGRGAFAGRSDLEEVKLSAGITEIMSGAFSECEALVYVYIPTTVKEIASDAFENSDNVIIYCAEGSYAEHFASDNGITCYTN